MLGRSQGAIRVVGWGLVWGVRRSANFSSQSINITLGISPPNVTFQDLDILSEPVRLGAPRRLVIDLSIPASGKRVHITGISIARIVNGQTRNYIFYRPKIRNAKQINVLAYNPFPCAHIWVDSLGS
jgi:hypothetical protein